MFNLDLCSKQKKNVEFRFEKRVAQLVLIGFLYEENQGSNHPSINYQIINKIKKLFNLVKEHAKYLISIIDSPLFHYVVFV